MRKQASAKAMGARLLQECPPQQGRISCNVSTPDAITRGFEDTHWIAGSTWRGPIQAEGDAILTCIAPYG